MIEKIPTFFTHLVNPVGFKKTGSLVQSNLIEAEPTQTVKDVNRNNTLSPLNPTTLFTVFAKKQNRATLYFQGCREDAQKLWNEYMSGKKPWSSIMDEAHRRENTGRAAVLNQWNIRQTGYQAKINEDVVFRTGTDPTTTVGRGEFSDEDLTANTLTAWNQLEEAAKKHNFSIRHDEQAGFFCIPELNTLVWKPKEPVPLEDEHRFKSYLKTISTHPEVIDPASCKPQFSMEYVLAMINKGQNGLCAPVENWGNNSYQRYETLIQLAKSTHHAMDKTELAKQHPADYSRLWELCKMRQSPEQLKIFKPGDSEDTILQGLKREQALMQKLMAAAFDKAQQDLNTKVEEFTRFLRTSKSAQIPTDRLAGQKIYENPEDTYQRLCKIKMQLDILNQSQHHAPFIRRLFNDEPHARRTSFSDFQNHLKKKIEDVSQIDQEKLSFNQSPKLLQWLA